MLHLQLVMVHLEAFVSMVIIRQHTEEVMCLIALVNIQAL